MTTKTTIAVIIQAALITIHPLHAAVTLDGTLGRSGSVTGPNYAISSDMGRQLGNNLFHSFSVFNLVKNDIATFSGTNISNIISRVTGGSASSIDGTIRSTIPGANMYFINPAGIMFGPDASLDISGSFHISTADYLKLGTDGRFDAVTPLQSVLTTSPPSAFGFATASPAPISINNSQLAVSKAQSITIVAGAIDITNSSQSGTLLYAPEGRINLVSVASTGEAPIHDDQRIDSSSFVKMGEITITNTTGYNGIADIDTSGQDGPAGKITITGNTLFVDGAGIVSESLYETTQTAHNSGIDIHMRDFLYLNNNAVISTACYANLDGAPISITSNRLKIDNGSRIESSTWSETAKGGDISITTGSLEILNGGTIESNSWYGGNGGNITVTAADQLTITGPGAPPENNDFLIPAAGIYARTVDSGNAGNIEILTPALTLEKWGAISASTIGTGNAGSIAISAAGTIAMTDGGYILSSTKSTGNSGDISIESNRLDISGTGSGISSSTFAEGNGGNISIKAADSISIVNGGSLLCQAEDESGGNAGKISIETGTLAISGNDSGISSSTYAEGNGGDISIKVSDMFSIANGGALLSVAGSGSRGNAGNIAIAAGNMKLSSSDSGISSSTFSVGNGGDISITASGTISISDGSVIAGIAQAASEGKAGTISIEAGNLFISGNTTGIASSTLSTGHGGNTNIRVSDTLNMTNGGKIESVADTGSSGNAGNIRVETGKLIISGSESGISASTYSDGDSGNISIKASDTLSIANGGALLSVAGSGSKGIAGNITIESGKVSISGSESGISASTYANGNGGNITITALDTVSISDGAVVASIAQAESKGMAGTITVDAKEIFISGSATGITSSTFSGGNGGNVNIRAADTVRLANGGRIESIADTGSTGNAGSIAVNSAKIIIDADSGIAVSTNGGGTAGNIALTAPSITITGKGTVSALSEQDSTGKGGNISVQSSDLYLSGGTVIAGAYGKNDGGDIAIDTDTLVMVNKSTISSESQMSGKAGNITIKAEKQIKLVDSSVTTATVNSDGGSITIDPLLVHLKNSSITTSVKGGNGNGGNINLVANHLLIDNSKIVAQADAGSGGNINLNAGVIIQSPSGSLISASSNLGLQGSVMLASPVLDVNAALVEMPTTLKDSISLTPRRCITTGDDISSFVVYACGASPRQPDAALISR